MTTPRDLEMKRAMDLADRLFCGVYPNALVWADRKHEVNGDYKRLGALYFHNLELHLEKDCPSDLAAEITKEAAGVQAQIGRPYQISTCGQTVILGGHKKENCQ